MLRTKTNSRKTTDNNSSRFSLGRTTRRNVSQDDLLNKIQQRAYYIYEKRGYSNGNDIADWLEAERQVKSELNIK